MAKAPSHHHVGNVGMTYIAPHQSINGAWPMATPAGRPARWPLAAWPPGSLAAGRMAARLAGHPGRHGILAFGARPPG
jgi:hypothetical protein